MSEEENISTRERDNELVARAREGDTEAFDALINAYAPKLYGLVYHMTSNHEDTNDLLQDVFAKAYGSLKRFHGKSAFYTWIYSIATNTTLNFLKKRKRRVAMSLDDMDNGIINDEVFTDLSHHANPREGNRVKELQKKLNEALQQLSDDHRAVVTMFDIQGMRHGDIGKILGLSEGTVRSRLYYAHQQLQAHLTEFR